MNDLLRNAQEFMNQWGTIAIGAAAALVVLFVIWRIVRRRKPQPIASSLPKAIDVATLGDAGPPPGPPVLEFYNIPVRIAAVVLASAGRVRELPSALEVYKLLDAVVPGLDRVADLHQPIIHRWPRQVSARGFAHTFFAQVRLPGDGGKGTPWSSAAGMFKLDRQPLMVGLVFHAATANSFGQIVIDSEEKWLGCLRVRHGA